MDKILGFRTEYEIDDEVFIKKYINRWEQIKEIAKVFQNNGISIKIILIIKYESVIL